MTASTTASGRDRIFSVSSYYHPLNSAADLECKMCGDFFDDPIVIDCGHTFCRKCVFGSAQASQTNTITCVVCLQTTQKPVELLRPNRVLRETTSHYIGKIGTQSNKRRLCSNFVSCHSGSMNHCNDCRLDFCVVCAALHSSTEPTHKITTGNGSPRGSYIINDKCDNHDLKLDSYCKTCSLPICEKCKEDQHAGDAHAIMDIVAAAEQRREKVLSYTNHIIEAKQKIEQLINLDMAEQQSLIEQIEKLTNRLQVVQTQIQTLKVEKDECDDSINAIQRIARQPTDAEILDRGINRRIMNLVQTQFGNSLVSPRPVFSEKQMQKSRFWMHSFGGYGSGNGQFNLPSAVTVTLEGQIIVADRNNHRVQVFNSQGSFVRTFGSFGTAAGHMHWPHGVAVNARGHIFVADCNNHRIQKFRKNGEFLHYFGSQGSEKGQFINPHGVAVDLAGRVIVTDYGNHRVQIFGENGEFLHQFGSKGDGVGSFKYPKGVAIDAKGNIYVTEYGNNRVQIFSSSGSFIKMFGTKGKAPGQLLKPYGIIVEGGGNIIIADRSNHRIQIFNSEGEYVRMFGGKGAVNGRLNQPYGVAVDNSGDIVVVDRNNHRIQIFG